MQGCNDCVFDYDGNFWITVFVGKIVFYLYERLMEVDYVQNLYNFIYIDYFIEYDLEVAVLKNFIYYFI